MKMINVTGENSVIIKDLWDKVNGTNRLREYNEFWEFIEDSYPEAKGRFLKFFPQSMMIKIYK